jgi:hypothetical protein
MIVVALIAVLLVLLVAGSLYAYRCRANEVGSFGIALVIVLTLFLLGYIHGY